MKNYKAISWIGKKGNNIELRAYCNTTMIDDTVDADGDIINVGKKPYSDANLELWVDGKMMDSCWNTNFWKIIDSGNGFKIVWGLKIGMADVQADIVAKFMADIIEAGKSDEVIAYEIAKAEAEIAAEKAAAQKIVDEAAKYTAPLMTNSQYQVWAKRYNDINNDGGYGYVPEYITVEQFEAAKEILAK